MDLTFKQLVEATGGVLCGTGAGEVSVKSISTDSRSIQEGALFVPIVGERFDGHDYIQQAVSLGACCVLTEKTLGESLFPYILVKCTRQALLDIASFYLDLHDVNVVAISGSAGKTTTKDMIASVLSRKFRTKKTPGNYNNEIGLPLSIFGLEKSDEVVVLEMGMNHSGEIRKLTQVAKPDVAVVTNIGFAHIGNFKDQTGVLHAELEIAEGLRRDGRLFLNGDDPLLSGGVAKELTESLSVCRLGAKNIKSVKSLGLDGSNCHFRINGQDVFVNIPLPGRQLVTNALLACAVGLYMGVAPEEITRGFADYEPTAGRLNAIKSNERTIINDAYNASPDSVKNALEVLSKEEGRKVAVLGDMLELGAFAEECHIDVGKYAAGLGIDIVVTVGNLAKHICEGFDAVKGKHQSSLPFPEKKDFLIASEKILQSGDIILVKASRGAKFEEITEKLV